MAAQKVQEIKKILIGQGFLVYRSGTDDVQLAERVRDNLIMDASVAVLLGDPLRVRLLARAQRSDFPWSNENPAALFERARRAGAPAAAKGFREAGTLVTPQLDPIDSSIELDVWYQVVFEKEVANTDELSEMLRFALSLEKVATR